MPHYSGKFDSKLPRVGTTIFIVMSQLAAEHDAINLSQGFPDFDCAAELRALVTKYLGLGLNQYPPMPGVPGLREAIAEKVQVSDEVYEHIVFDGHAHQSVARFAGLAKEASPCLRSERPITSPAGKWVTCVRRTS
jgi:aspartate/methionine/tyrosine aminotransferase